MLLAESIKISVPHLETPVDTVITLFWGEHSKDLFEVKGIEQTTGLKQNDAEAYPETEKDAYIFGLVNATTQGKIFLFTNITRLAHETNRNAPLSDLNYLGHELFHLVRIIQAQAKLGAKFLTDDWPTIGGEITEADTAELQGVILEAIMPSFVELLDVISE